MSQINDASTTYATVPWIKAFSFTKSYAVTLNPLILSRASDALSGRDVEGRRSPFDAAYR
jgi:hypothetical protein